MAERKCKTTFTKSEQRVIGKSVWKETENGSDSDSPCKSAIETDLDFEVTCISDSGSGSGPDSDLDGESDSDKYKESKVESEIEDDKSIYKCDLCPFKTRTRQGINNHNFVHTGEKQFSCDFPGCEFRTAHAGSLKWHKKRHENKREFKCLHCSYAANCLTSYKAHLVIHTKERNYACPLCDHRTTQKSHLTVHLRTHTGEKPYKCSFCPFAAADKRNLTTHEYTHSDLKPFACTFCSFKSRQKSHLNGHLKRHLKEKSYKCPYCMYTAVDKLCLQSHVETHFDARNKHRKCPVSGCGYGTTQPTPWKTHLKNHHGLDPKEIAAKLKTNPDICIRDNQNFQPSARVRQTQTFKLHKCPEEKCKYSTNRFDLHAAHLNVRKLPRVLLTRI